MWQQCSADSSHELMLVLRLNIRMGNKYDLIHVDICMAAGASGDALLVREAGGDWLDWLELTEWLWWGRSPLSTAVLPPVKNMLNLEADRLQEPKTMQGSCQPGAELWGCRGTGSPKMDRWQLKKFSLFSWFWISAETHTCKDHNLVLIA